MSMRQNKSDLKENQDNKALFVWAGFINLPSLTINIKTYNILLYNYIRLFLNASVSKLTPGPIVEDNETFFT